MRGSSSSTASSKAASRLLLIGSDATDGLAARMYNAGFRDTAMDARCEARAIAPDALAEAIAGIRSDPKVLGAAVSMPHTVAASRLLDGLGPEAQAIRAVNTISHRSGALIGWNTDRPAFTRALDDAGYVPKGRPVLVLGAGGAARAVVDALRGSGAKIWISSRDLAEARALCSDLDITSGGATPLGSLALLVRKVELIVNATPVGSDGSAVVFPVEWITPSHFVFDLLYEPQLTPLVRAARARGARASNGLTMLLYQGLAAFEIWTGQSAPEGAMRAALEQAVLGRLNQ